jgi:hypothetical protein
MIISKEQKTSEFRQAWINTLRDDISKFIGQVDSVTKLVLINKTSKYKEKTSSAIILGSTEMREVQLKINLLINPKEYKHQDLVALLNAITENITTQTNNNENIVDLTTLSQKILKKEWDRVKDGEPIFKISKWIFGLTTVWILVYAIYKLLSS